MSRVVCDASALVEWLLRTAAGERVRSILEPGLSDLHVPMLCDVEVAAGLRRSTLRGVLTVERMGNALTDYLDLRLERHPHDLLLGRTLEMRENFSAYDAVYVALAERLDAAFLSADERLIHAVRRHTDVIVARW